MSIFSPSRSYEMRGGAVGSSQITRPVSQRGRRKLYVAKKCWFRAAYDAASCRSSSDGISQGIQLDHEAISQKPLASSCFDMKLIRSESSGVTPADR
jgi:hypothetical protein